MELVVGVILAIVALAGLGFILRNYRQQRDWEEPPGKVPEDYS
jgi:hypothetical protein